MISSAFCSFLLHIIILLYLNSNFIISDKLLLNQTKIAIKLVNSIDYLKNTNKNNNSFSSNLNKLTKNIKKKVDNKSLYDHYENDVRNNNKKIEDIVNNTKNEKKIIYKPKKNILPKKHRRVKEYDSELENIISDSQNGDIPFINQANDESQLNINNTLNESEISLLKECIHSCWKIPYDISNKKKLIVVLDIKIDKYGNILTITVRDKERMNYDRDYKILAESAIKALLDPRCKPLPLPSNKYHQWKNLSIVFNPKEFNF